MNCLWCTDSSRYAIEDSGSGDKCFVFSNMEVVKVILEWEEVLHILCTNLYAGTIKVFVNIQGSAISEIHVYIPLVLIS